MKTYRSKQGRKPMNAKVKGVAAIALVVVSMSAFAHSHYWSKVSQQQGVNGQVVCQWKCGFGNQEHYRTTSGYGVCPVPY